MKKRIALIAIIIIIVVSILLLRGSGGLFPKINTANWIAPNTQVSTSPSVSGFTLELFIASLLSFIGGALIPLIGIWFQSQWKQRERTLKHEESLFQKRMEIASKTINICYKFFTTTHRLATSHDEEEKTALKKQRAQIKTQIFEIEPEVDLFFPQDTVIAFRHFLSSVDEIVYSKLHWTVIGSRLDSEFTILVNKVRSGIGIQSTESKLSQALPEVLVSETKKE